MHSSNMERISKWVASQEIPSDLTVRIGDSLFPLHKAVMVAKCGYIRRAVAAAASNKDAGGSVTELDLSAIPGGADAFEKAALYCYGAGATTNLEMITARNAAALLCAAAFLDMPPADGLVRRVEEFLSHSGLRTLPNAVAVLRSCERLLPYAEELGIAHRAADAVALKICNEAMFPTTTTRSALSPGWWAAELAALSPAMFGKVVTALRCRRAAPQVVASAAAAYAEITLAEFLAGDLSNQKGDLLEAVVDVLPPASDAPLPVAFLCRLLHAAVNSNATAKTCRGLELRVAALLDQATPGDLLGVALDAAGERVTNADTVRRVVTAFFAQRLGQQQQSSRGRRASLSSGVRGAEDETEVDSNSKVARIVDEAAAEMATEEDFLPVSQFVGVVGAVPREIRTNHDYLYRAIDIYLKTHPELDEIQREKVCSVMDPLRLSYQARLHASQNKRLPLQAVLTALYYDQLNLRSSTTTPAAGVINNNIKDHQSSELLARENEALRLELARMRAYLSSASAATMPQLHSTRKGITASSGSPVDKKKKKTSFLLLGSVVSRTLSRLNPFNKTKNTTTSSMAGDGDTHDHHLVKPRRRRFSIS